MLVRYEKISDVMDLTSKTHQPGAHTILRPFTAILRPFTAILRPFTALKLRQRRVSVAEARCSSVVRAFAHGAMGRRIDPSWGGPIELFLVPASAPQLV